MSLPTPKKGQRWTHRMTGDVGVVRAVQEMYVQDDDGRHVATEILVVTDTADSKYGGPNHTMVWKLSLFHTSWALYIEVTPDVFDALSRGGYEL